MKKTNLTLAVILSLNFSLPTYASQTTSAKEAEIRRAMNEVNLKVKSENLQSLLKAQWIIENMYSDNAESLYINHIDNPAIGTALGFLAAEGLIVYSSIDQNRLKGMTVNETVKNHFKNWRANHGVGSLILFAFATPFGMIFYAAPMQKSETAKFRDHYIKLAKAGQLDEAYKANQSQIEIISKEIIELKNQLAN